MKKTKILVIDDSMTDLLVIKDMLKEYNVLCASNGVEAIQIIKDNKAIDLIMLDINMPDMNSFEVLDMIQFSEVYRKIRVIILTDNNEIEKEIKGLKSGAIDYIRKPIRKESLKARIDIHVRLLQIQKLIEQKFIEQSFTFDAIFYEAPIGIAISFNDELLANDYNNTLRINPMFESITGYSKEELQALGWDRITSPDEIGEDLINYTKLQNDEIEEYAMDKRFIKQDGTAVWVHMVVAKLKLLHDNRFNHICLIQDISRRKNAESKLRDSEKTMALLLSHLPGMAYRCEFDQRWCMKYVSDGSLKLTGYPHQAFVDNEKFAYLDIVALEYQKNVFHQWDQAIKQNLPFYLEYEIVVANNTRKWVLEMGQGITNSEGKVDVIESLVLDITQRKKMEDELRYNSNHDSLTGLYNLNYLVSQLKIDRKLLEKRALIGINLSDLHSLTTTFGFEYTIEVKKKIALALLKIHQDNKLLFNTYENQFVSYYKGYNNQQELLDFCDEIVEILNHELLIEQISGGLGVIEIDEYDDLGIDHLLRNILVASEHANNISEYSFGLCFYDESMRGKMIRDEDIKRIINQITVDKKGCRLVLQFQPIYDLSSNRVIGFEALSRLYSDEFGLITPIEFIPVAEKSKQIITLGEKIISQALDFLKELENQGFHDAIVSINISAIQLMRHDFVEMLSDFISKKDVQARSVLLEMTESVLANNFDKINRVFKELQDLGVKIALDDFGTGYSSLARESELNIDILKIDKHFINNLSHMNHNQALTGSIVSMAHLSSRAVIAEGVEYENQMEYLRNHDCDMIQGYLISRPLDQADAIAFLIKTNKL